MTSIDSLTNEIRLFAEERDWGQFHLPRNLLLALVGEVGELAAEFQWCSDDGVVKLLADAPSRSRVESELADVATYLLRLADVMDMDLEAAIRSKLALNEDRYPADTARGSSAKYTELSDDE